MTAYQQARAAGLDTPELEDAQIGLLVDQGLADPFLETQLRPDRLEQACAEAGQPLLLRRHAGYDHSYWFIQSFIGAHLEHHARAPT